MADSFLIQPGWRAGVAVFFHVPHLSLPISRRLTHLPATHTHTRHRKRSENSIFALPHSHNLQKCICSPLCGSDLKPANNSPPGRGGRSHRRSDHFPVCEVPQVDYGNGRYTVTPADSTRGENVVLVCACR